MQPPFQESFVYPWQSFLEIPINGRSAGRWWSVRVWAGACDLWARARPQEAYVGECRRIRAFRAVTFASVLARPLRQRYNKRGYVYASSDKRPRTQLECRSIFGGVKRLGSFQEFQMLRLMVNLGKNFEFKRSTLRNFQ